MEKHTSGTKIQQLGWRITYDQGKRKLRLHRAAR
jgi:hypothetical protein